jgi:hypothetical protein
VPDGVYDRGGRRDNPREAEVVADLVLAQFRDHPDRTVGVIAFSHPQMDAIADEIERRCRERPELERFLQDDRLEGFFVKNLETVQGDERDVILFSIGYGRDRHGKLTLNFGPLNQAEGERRLNVAVTRAREKVVVVSSIRAADLDLGPSAPSGVQRLRDYLEYAEHGPAALASGGAGSGAEEGSRVAGAESSKPRHSAPDSGATPGLHCVQPRPPDIPIEEDVRRVLEGMGYTTVSRVGCSGFRTDLGVLDPAQPGSFLLGVECDGDTYRAAATTRDRDRLRPEILHRLGWRLHRIWSLDWLRHRREEIERLRQALDTALRDRSAAPLPASPGPMTPISGEPPRRVVIGTPGENGSPFPGTVPYRVCELHVRKEFQGGEFHDRAARQEQCRLVCQLVRAEGPIHMDLVVDRLRRSWGLARAGERVRQTVEEAVALCEERGHVHRRGGFLWPTAEAVTAVRVADPEAAETCRDISYIAPEELQSALQLLLAQGVALGEEDLLAQTARVLGFGRLGDLIRQRLADNLATLRRQGRCLKRGESITLAPAEVH